MKDNPLLDTELDVPADATEHIQSDDPRSVHYKRVLIRPRLNILRVLLYVMCALTVSAAVGVAAYFIFSNSTVAYWSAAGTLATVAVIFAKDIAIWLVMAYQRIAPASLRKSCRYEPSCSQYMILSLKKYGFIKGLRRGIARWHRCKPPYGGYDSP